MNVVLIRNILICNLYLGGDRARFRKSLDSDFKLTFALNYNAFEELSKNLHSFHTFYLRFPNCYHVISLLLR